jgi:photosystem II protein PsbQ
MRIFRSILSLALVLVTTFLVSCGSPSASAPPTYTPEKLEQIQIFRIPIDEARQRMLELATDIAREDWVDTQSFIHGPLGQLRRDMIYLANALLPEEQKEASTLAKEVFRHLEDLDAAAKEQNSPAAQKQFVEAIRDFDAYIQLIPQSEEST